MISAIIMASGFSNRMGKNKLLMNYNNKPIIQNVLEVVKKYNFKDKVVVSQYDEVLCISNKHGFKSVINTNAYLGQSESIKLGIKSCDECDGYMFFVGDQPLIQEEDINKLTKAFEENKDYIIIPTYKEIKGNPVIFPSNLKEKFLKLEGDKKGKDIIKDYKKIKFVEVNKKTLIDIDTVKDYENIIKNYCV